MTDNNIPKPTVVPIMTTTEFTITNMIQSAIVLTLVIVMMKMFTGKWAWEPLHLGAAVPAGKARKAQVEAQLYTARREEQLERRRLELEGRGRSIAVEAGVELARLDEDWRTTELYWFRDEHGVEMRARDLDELRWKLSFIRHSE
jgi:hypothetical protein